MLPNATPYTYSATICTIEYVWYNKWYKYIVIKRRFWLEKISDSWKRKSVIWLSGIRRAGKTFLCRSIENTEFFDCEIQKTRRELEDAEAFLKSLGKNKTIVLDEVHRLNNPSEILKIAADYFPHIKVIATGSSSLSASRKFRDTLTDRKTNLWLTPMTSEDLFDFKNEKVEHRFLFGGLPPFFLSKDIPERSFQDWMDSYWAKDIQELFRLMNRASFQKFLELLFTQSGGIFEATRFTKPCEVSRTAINNYLKALEETYVAHIIKPFSTYKPTEIISAPKVYGFDTGFISYHKGWEKLRSEDMGFLWEHFVLNEIFAHRQSRKILYWRDKRGHEVDFIIQNRGKEPIAIECKWKSDHFNSSGIEAFRRQYLKGKNFVVAQDVNRQLKKTFGEIEVTFISLRDLIDEL